MHGGHVGLALDEPGRHDEWCECVQDRGRGHVPVQLPDRSVSVTGREPGLDEPGRVELALAGPIDEIGQQQFRIVAQQRLDEGIVGQHVDRPQTEVHQTLAGCDPAGGCGGLTEHPGELGGQGVEHEAAHASTAPVEGHPGDPARVAMELAVARRTP